MDASQKFHGLKKLMLNNSIQDPSYLNERICGYLFRQAGVPSPRTGHALVVLNGKKLGLYVTKQDFGKDFLKRWFKDASGNLYDINPGREVSEEMRLDSGVLLRQQCVRDKTGAVTVGGRQTQRSHVCHEPNFRRQTSINCVSS